MGFRSVVVPALVVCAATACGGDAAAPETPDASLSEAPRVATLSVADYAYLPLADLLAEYNAAHPGQALTIIAEPHSSSFRPTVEDALAGTDPLPDVVVFDLASLAAVEASGKYDGAVALTADPASMCFRPDLLAEAGIASSREEFADLLSQNGGGWDQYFAVGRQYTAATGRAWFDGPSAIWQAMPGQLPEGYTVPDRAVSVADDPELRELWDLLGSPLADGLSAGEQPWDWSGGAALGDESFATMPCSPSTRAAMQALAEASGTAAKGAWDMADAFPGGGWMAGGTYVAASKAAPDAEAAAELVGWLTAPEQQAALGDAGIGMPAEAEAQSDWANLLGEGLFAEVPTGAIDVKMADAAPDHVAGPDDAMLVVTVIVPILDRIAAGDLSVEAGWAELVAAVG